MKGTYTPKLSIMRGVLNGIRCLNGIGCETSFPRLAVQPSPKTALEIRIAALAARPASKLVDELMKLRPQLTMRKTLMHFTRLKLAGLVIDARKQAADALKATA